MLSVRLGALTGDAYTRGRVDLVGMLGLDVFGLSSNVHVYNRVALTVYSRLCNALSPLLEVSCRAACGACPAGYSHEQMQLLSSGTSRLGVFRGHCTPQGP